MVIVFDYALTDKLETYDPVVQKAIIVTSKGGAAAIFESLQELNAHYENSGLKLEKCTDHTRAILPDLKRLERKATKILKRPLLTKLLFWLMPDAFVANIAIGYIAYDSASAGIGSYREWILRKP